MQDLKDYNSWMLNNLWRLIFSMLKYYKRQPTKSIGLSFCSTKPSSATNSIWKRNTGNSWKKRGLSTPTVPKWPITESNTWVCMSNSKRPKQFSKTLKPWIPPRNKVWRISLKFTKTAKRVFSTGRALWRETESTDNLSTKTLKLIGVPSVLACLPLPTSNLGK